MKIDDLKEELDQTSDVKLPMHISVDDVQIEHPFEGRFNVDDYKIRQLIKKTLSSGTNLSQRCEVMGSRMQSLTGERISVVAFPT